jgi:hypothetical protein
MGAMAGAPRSRARPWSNCDARRAIEGEFHASFGTRLTKGEPETEEPLPSLPSSKTSSRVPSIEDLKSLRDDGLHYGFRSLAQLKWSDRLVAGFP